MSPVRVWKVKGEDLSDRDTHPGLVQNTQGLLSKILRCDAQEMQEDAYSKSRQHEECTISGLLGAYRVCRKTYQKIDACHGPTF